METMLERSMAELKAKYDKKYTFTMSRRQAIKVLQFIEDQKREWQNLEDHMRDVLGLNYEDFEDEDEDEEDEDE